MIDNESIVMIAIEKLDNKFEKLDEKVDGMTKILSKQELILEKIQHTDNTISNVSKTVHKRIDDICNRVHSIEDNQTTQGCSQLNSLKAQRNEQVKAFEKESESLSKCVAKNRADIEELKSVPNKIMFKVVTGVLTTAVLGALAFYFGDKR